MNLILNHQQTKNNKTTSTCDIRAYEFLENFHVFINIAHDYTKLGSPSRVSLHHTITINLKTGDITTLNQISHESISEKITTKSKILKRKNDFKSISNAVQNGIYRGERKRGFWGVKYQKMVNNLYEILFKRMETFLISNHHIIKNYNLEYSISPIFDMLVDFHFIKKDIKLHDSPYHMVQNEYPKRKWLKLNENKFVPAVLDSYGIKSKYLVAYINESKEKNINILSLAYLCKLFGSSHIDYLRKLNWIDLTNHEITIRRKFHTLKNENEKKLMVKLLNSWQKNPPSHKNIFEIINNILTIRDFLESKSLKIKFNVTNVEDVELFLSKLKSFKKNFKRGYSLEYIFDENFLEDIENNIKIDTKIFKVRILKTEEDFFTEGYIMKNCMSKQFIKGVIFIYISMTNGKSIVNLEYKDGDLITSYGKANTPVNEEFIQPIKILSKKMKEYSNINWTKQKKNLKLVFN